MYGISMGVGMIVNQLKGVQSGAMGAGSNASNGGNSVYDDPINDTNTKLTVDESCRDIAESIRYNAGAAKDQMNYTNASLSDHVSEAFDGKGIVLCDNDPVNCEIKPNGNYTVGWAKSTSLAKSLPFLRHYTINICINNAMAVGLRPDFFLHEFPYVWGWQHNEGISVPWNSGSPP
jgi:hypothetical protein